MDGETNDSKEEKASDDEAVDRGSSDVVNEGPVMVWTKEIY